MIHKGHSRCHKVVSLFLCPVVIQTLSHPFNVNDNLLPLGYFV
nr:MAG TPA: hypothetical protein [Caudoviricetes sp.]